MLGEENKSNKTMKTWNALEEISNFSFLPSHMRYRKRIVSQVRESESKFIELISKYKFEEKGVGVNRKGV